MADKRAKPDLSERWWKQAWPIDGKAPEFAKVTNAIKAYKIAKRGLSQSELMRTLDELDVALVISEVKSRKDLAGLDAKTKPMFGDDIKAVRKILAAQMGDAQRVGDAQELVYSRNIGPELMSRFKKLGDNKIKFGAIQVDFKLLVAVVNEIKAKGGDSFLSRAYSDLVNDHIGQIEKAVRADYVEIFNGDDVKAAAFIKKTVDGEMVKLHKAALKVPTNVLRKLGIYGDIEKTYAGRIAKKVGKTAVSSVSAVGAGVGILLPGTPAFAIVGCCLASAAALRDIADLAMTLEQKACVLGKYLKPVATNLKRATIKAGSVEFSAALGNELLGVDVFPTLKKAKTDFKDIEEGVQILMHRLGVKQKKTLEALAAHDEMLKNVKKKMAEASAGAAGGPLIKAQKTALLQAHKNTVKAGKILQDLASSTSNMMARGIKLEKKCDKLLAELKRLDGFESKVKGVQKAADWIGIVKTLAVGISGVADAATFTECGKIYSDAQRYGAVANSGAALAKDIGQLAVDRLSG
ncbi:MAG: hypothetical protein AB8B51_14495 [Sedimentitalea sp.]